jgi:hypothetical protein
MDELERGIYRHVVDAPRLSRIEPRPFLEEARLCRGSDGQILVPVTIDAERPSLSLAMLMAHKSDDPSRRGGCQLVLIQGPLRNPNQKAYVWNGTWQTLE